MPRSQQSPHPIPLSRRRRPAYRTDPMILNSRAPGQLLRYSCGGHEKKASSTRRLTSGCGSCLDRGWSRQAPPWSAPSQTAAGEHVEETTPSYAPSVERPQPTATSLTPAPPPPAPPSARPPTAAIRQRSAPAPFAVTAGRIWKAGASDFALHGFAYIGVVLTFVGVLGFLLYAFVDIPDAAQPFVELFIALIFFGWAWALHRQQAHRVAEGMSWIGKTLLPFILFAGLVDSAPFPPDFQGGGLVAALTLTAAGTAAVYAWQATRNPSSTLRFLVAPLLWLAALSLGFIFKSDEALAGDAITRLVSGQGALVAVAIAVTLVAALWRPEHRFAAPTVRSALVGLPVAYLMTISLAAAESWQHLLPLVVLGIATSPLPRSWRHGSSGAPSCPRCVRCCWPGWWPRWYPP